MYNPTTISDKDGIPIFWKNNHDFNDESGSAPKPGELFIQVFTEPWMAQAYIKSGSFTDAPPSILLIKKQEDLDFLVKVVAKGEGVTRGIVNLCNLSNESHERLFATLPLEGLDDMDNFVEMLANVEICPICYNKDIFIEENDMGENVSIITI